MNTSSTEAPFWKKCTSCKQTIGFHQKYWICSVSTCNRQRTGLTFCSVACFDAHIPVMNHRDAGAFEKRSPTRSEWERQIHAENAEKQPVTNQPSSPVQSPRPASISSSAPSSISHGTPVFAGSSATPEEILVVVSKVKDYIRSRSGMNTSENVMKRLTVWVQRWCDDSIRRAAQDERKTVLDRDVR